MKKISRLFVYLSSVSLLLVGASARAEGGSVLAFDNATVQPAGPRSGVNGKRFFNMEGNANGNFSSFGVADFNFPDLEGDDHGEMVKTLTLTFVQANAAFTHDGALHFWLSTDNATDIQPNDNPAVRFILTDDPDGLDQQLERRFFLGSGMFVQVDDGQVDSYSFRLTGQAKQYVRRQLEEGGNIRLIVSPADSTVAATYAGFSNDEFPGPVLTINAEDD
jgi:hypothetical protein